MEPASETANYAFELLGLKMGCYGTQGDTEANMVVHYEPLNKLGRTNVLSNVFSEVDFQITAFEQKKSKFS